MKGVIGETISALNLPHPIIGGKKQVTRITLKIGMLPVAGDETDIGDRLLDGEFR